MSEVREGLRYTSEHEWAKVEGENCRVGITDHAQEEMTEIVYSEVPVVGKTVRKGEPLGAVESVKTVADVYAPVSGQVVETNKEVEENPQLVNDSPYEKGWFALIRMTDQAELEDLMDADQYREFLGE
jgi:glycine cleavage system H protein